MAKDYFGALDSVLKQLSISHPPVNASEEADRRIKIRASLGYYGLEHFETEEVFKELEKVEYITSNLRITLKGLLFIEAGGYTQQQINLRQTSERISKLEHHQSQMANKLFWLNVLISFGTLIAALYYLNELCQKYHWFQFCNCH